MTDYSIIGTSPIRKDAFEKVTGRAKYTADFYEPGMLHIKVLRSPHAHARIKGIDTSRAEKLPGVRGIVRPEDAPDQRIGFLFFDTQLLAGDGIVRYIGDAIALVVAESVEIAEAARDLIEVDYEELPAVFDAEESMTANPPVIIHPNRDTYFAPPGFPNVTRGFELPNVFHKQHHIKGDIEKGFAEADVIVENRYSFDRVHHCQLEGHVADAWLEDDGTLFVRHSTPGVHTDIVDLQHLFGLPRSKIRVLAPYVGGAFGGKGFLPEAFLAALAALKLNSRKPVRYQCTREEEFISCGQRPKFVTYVKDGVKKDGTIVARDVKAIHDVGAYAGLGGGDMASLFCSQGPGGHYKIPNYRWITYGVYTNLPPSTAFRGVGAPETNWGIEQQIDLIADKLGLDPLEVKMKNLCSQEDSELHGWRHKGRYLKECLDYVAKRIEWDKKPETEGQWRKGKGVAVGSWQGAPLWPASSEVSVGFDGSFEVVFTDSEVGQGNKTVFAEIVAEEFGAPMELVKVIQGDTLNTPPGFASVASRNTFYGGNAILNACRDAKRQLSTLAAPRLEAAPDELEVRGGRIYHRKDPERGIAIADLFIPPYMFIPGTGRILGRGEYSYPIGTIDPVTGQSERFHPFSGCVAYGVEAAVNVETGEVRLERIVACSDIGQVINQKAWEGQIEGGIVMGLGTTLFERIVLDEGNVLNPNFADYKIPRAPEAPRNDRVESGHTLGYPHEGGPFGAKGGGETVLIAFAPAVGEAIHRALGVTIKDASITREAILDAVQRSRR